jgi:hypothetical protein
VEPSDLQSLIQDGGQPSAKDENIAALERRAEELRDQRNEERFLFCLIVVIIVDAHIFSHMQSWGGPVAIFLLELVGLIVMSRRFGIEDVQRLIDRCIESWGAHGKPK